LPGTTTDFASEAEVRRCSRSTDKRDNGQTVNSSRSLLLSEFYHLRRTAIKDLAAYCGFLLGFLGSAPFAWRYLTGQIDTGDFARGLGYFLSYVTVAGLVTGSAGFLIGIAGGWIWERYHRYRRAARGTIDSGITPAPQLRLVADEPSSVHDSRRAAVPRVGKEHDTGALMIHSGNSQELWNAVDDYIDEVVQPESALHSALAASTAAGLPAIAVSPSQGKLLYMLARVLGARRILEVGTLGGYSTIWLARALPADGRLITLELDAKHAEVARSNVSMAGLGDVVDVRVGAALDLLPAIAEEGGGPFDFVFIDADKQNIPSYFDWALKMSRPGSLIVVDNVVRNGDVIDAASDDASVIGVRRLNSRLAAEPRATATTIQTVGIKGYDGFTIALVTAGS
jgi:predicted O-methyltransferase YrrM